MFSDIMPIPPGLADKAPELVVMVLVIGAILGFMWKLWQSSTAFHDKWFERHETAEREQMQVIGKNTSASERMADAVGRLADRIGNSGSEFPLLTQDHMTHTIASPPADGPHIGTPDGHFEPPVSYSALALFQSGETGAWTITRYGIDKLHAQGKKGRGAKVAVIDTGLDQHPDLVANLDAEGSRNFVPRETIQDVNGHSTHCGGIVAADDNGRGVVGVAPDAKVVKFKGLSNAGNGLGSWLAGGIRAAADMPDVHILSLSFGSGGEDPQISAAVRYAIQKGKWVFAAAGNSGPGSVNWPGALPEVVCVGALDQNDRVARFSSANDFVDVGFGGVAILSTIPGNRYAPYDGTSMATPGVAGVAALAVGELLEAGLPIPNQAVMTEVLYSTCRDVGAPGRDPGAGWGLVQPAAFITGLVEKVRGSQPPVAPPVNPPPAPGDTRVINIAELQAKGIKRIVIEL